MTPAQIDYQRKYNRDSWVPYTYIMDNGNSVLPIHPDTNTVVYKTLTVIQKMLGKSVNYGN